MALGSFGQTVGGVFGGGGGSATKNVPSIPGFTFINGSWVPNELLAPVQTAPPPQNLSEINIPPPPTALPPGPISPDMGAAPLPSPLPPVNPPSLPSPLAPSDPIAGLQDIQNQTAPTLPETVAGATGVAPAAGGPSPGQAPALIPSGDVESPAPFPNAPPLGAGGPQPIPFNPNTPSAPVPNFGPGANIEDFMGDLSKFQFGPEGILGVPGGPTRAKGQTEADFLRSLLNQGVLGAGL